MKYLLTLLLLLTGCATKPITNEHFVFIKPDKVPTIQVDSPNWSVVNQTELKQLANDPSLKDRVFYLLDESSFKQLMEGLIKIGDKLSKQDKVIMYYENSITEYEKAIEK